jgi:hypothetical protein
MSAGGAMRWRVVLEVVGAEGTTEAHEVGTGARAPTGHTAATLGLGLEDGKAILAQVQRHLVAAQVEEHCRSRRRCDRCGAQRPLKDLRPRRLTSLFGVVEVRAPRFGPCRCGVACRRSITPAAEVMPDRCTPEHVRSCQVRSFQAIVAQVGGAGGRPVVFGGVPAEADRQHQRLRGVLQGLGATPQTSVTILSDGADGPRSLGEAASPGPSRHVLDWFHLAMRIHHAARVAEAWPVGTPGEREDGTRLADAVERIRWRLWHGRVRRALDLIGETLAWLEGMTAPAVAAKVTASLHGLETYVSGQAGLIIDYAKARRDGEPISTATTEGTVQWLLHRRMGVGQQMRWSPRGAHRMLKVRTAVANGTLAADHAAAERWARRPFRPAA